VLLHGWMDVGASFQFVVDALAAADGFERWVLAPDWRGFGLTAAPAGTDSYWFPDYVADLDAAARPAVARQPVDLVGHSMGGNVVMLYAGCGRSASAGWSTWKASACPPRSRSRRRSAWRSGWTS
jgi:alpha-beta hydrolase superfamily lysophospholipase